MEKEAHQRKCQEFEAFEQLIATEAGVHPIVGPSTDPLSATVPSPDDVESCYST